MIRTHHILMLAALSLLAACAQTAPTQPVVSGAPAAPTLGQTIQTDVGKAGALAQVICQDVTTGEKFVQVFDPSLVQNNKNSVAIGVAACAAVNAIEVPTAAAPAATP